MSETAFPLGSLGVLLAMAAITYVWRSAGFWAMGLVPMTPRLRRGLDALPGAIIVATILPMVARTGLPAALAVAAAAGVAVLSRNEFLAVIAGAAVAAGVRLVM